MFEKFKYGWRQSGPFKRDINNILKEIRGDGYKISPDLIPRPKQIYKMVRRQYHGPIKTWIPLETGNEIPITDELIRRHILIIGTTGSGKTTLIKHLIKGLSITSGVDDKFVVFDPKGDYIDIFRDSNIPVYIVSEDPNLANVRWNLFRDAFYSSLDKYMELISIYQGDKRFRQLLNTCRESDVEQAIHIISEMLSSWRRFQHSYRKMVEALNHDLKLILSKIVDAKNASKSTAGMGDQRYFSRDAPLDMTTAVATAVTLTSIFLGDPSFMNNRILYEWCMKDQNSLIDIFYAYDLRGALAHIGEGVVSTSGISPQTQGVLSTFRQFIDEFLIGSFRMEGGFSLREAINRPGKAAILFEYRPGNEELMAPVFSGLIGMLIDEVLNRALHPSQGMVYFILDEFHALPKINKIETFINMSRSLGGAVIAGTQSYAQVKHTYGDRKAEALISAFNTRIFLRILDEDSFNLLWNSIGEITVYKKRVSKSKAEPSLLDGIFNTSHDMKGSETISHEIELIQIPKKILNSLPVGMGFTSISGLPPFILPVSREFHMYDVMKDLKREINYVE